MTLGEKIKKLRRDFNITQEEFAEKVGVSRQTVTKWEGDIGLPDADNLKNIARNFITYRYERTKARERNSQFMKDISEKLAASNVQNQNA